MQDDTVLREPRLACFLDACARRVSTFTLVMLWLMLTAAAANGQAVTYLWWDPPADGTQVSYIIEWGPAPGLYLASATVPAGTTSFQVPGLRPGLRYYFAVRATDAAGRRSGPSNEFSVVPAPALDAPAGPAGAASNAAWPDVTLDVTRAGAGDGRVASAPAGIDCGSTCRASLPRATAVTLVATASPGSRFVGWQGGGCSGDGTCAIALDASVTVTAEFARDGEPTGTSFARYLAEGADSHFFDTRIVLANPGALAATATLQFLREDGQVVTHAASVAPLSSTRVDAGVVPGLSGQAFATIVTSNTPLVVDRTMSWRGGSGVAHGAHAESSVEGPAPRWYLAEGATHAGFDLFYLLQNPNASVVWARIRYLRPTGGPLEKLYALPPRSRTSVWVDQEMLDETGLPSLASTEVSAVVETVDGSGIVVERAMYDSRRGVTFEAGHESAGVTAPSERWYFAEGATGPYFDLFLLIANPGAEAADVRVTYLLPDGTRVVREHRVGPSQRYTIWVDKEGGELADTAVSSIVESTNGVAVVAERSMWWPGDSGRWYEAHNAPGATVAGTRWAVADGESVQGGLGRSTYLLVANPSDVDARIRVTMLFGTGVPAVSREFPVRAGSRFDLSVGDAFPEAVGARCGALVESLGDSAAPIVVERAMYADAPGQPWASGTNLLATRLR